MMKNDGDYVREKSIAAAHFHYTRDFELPTRILMSSYSVPLLAHHEDYTLHKLTAGLQGFIPKLDEA